MAERTKKNKNNTTKADKAKLWNQFDTEIMHKPLECITTEEQQVGNREFCDHCQSSLMFSEEGYLTCSNDRCGVVYKDLLDHSPEWRYYGADDNQSSDPTRCGMPINPLLEESSYGCKVLCGFGSSSYEMRKIRRYTEWQSMPYKEKSQYDEFQRITTFAQNAGIPRLIIDEAIKYHKKISETNQTFRGDNKDGILSASIYIASKIHNYPITVKELARIFHLNVTNATQGCKIAQNILNTLERDMNIEEKTTFRKTRPEDFIESYCSKLNINSELTKLCQFVAIKIEKNMLMPENAPDSIAAGVIYFITQLCKLNVTKRDIKDKSEISEVTINKCYKKMYKHAKQLIPDAIIRKYNIVLTDDNFANDTY